MLVLYYAWCMLIYYSSYVGFLICLISPQPNKIAYGANRPLIYAIYARSLKCVKLLIEVSHFQLAVNGTNMPY
jgi:hypothetical protein